MAKLVITQVRSSNGSSRKQHDTLRSLGLGKIGQAIAQSGCGGTPGVVLGSDAASVFTEVQTLMASHRVWERFPSSIA